MKKLKTLFSLVLGITLFSAVLFAQSAKADTLTILVGDGGSNFSPQVTNAEVGDYIKFQYVAGFHTTTCDPATRPLTSLPAGAATWNETMQSSGAVFFYEIQVAGTYKYECIPHSPGMNGTINATVSSITQTSQQVPDRFALNQNYPNPFNPSTNINFNVASTGFVKLSVYDNLGREVSVLVNENLNPGTYEFNWNAANFNSGVYFYRLETQDFLETKKMLLIK